jgi:uncharacterized protein YjiS (DUF1127 family)
MTTAQLRSTALRSVPSVAARETTAVWRAAQLVALLRTWIKRARERHELTELNDAQLRDVGLSRHMVKREIEKPFWQG